MDQTISNRRFMNNAMFGIKNMEAMIRIMAIQATHQIIMQRINIVLQMTFKFLNVPASALPATEFMPGRKKVL